MKWNLIVTVGIEGWPRILRGAWGKLRLMKVSVALIVIVVKGVYYFERDRRELLTKFYDWIYLGIGIGGGW